LFPTEYHSNWQWWYLVSRAGAMILDGLPAELRPAVQVIDDWVTNRKLGLVFEASVGQGKLLVTSIDLELGRNTNPVVRQFRHSLLSYLQSDRFNPRVKLTPAQVRALMTEPTTAQRLGAKIIKATSAQAGFEPDNVLDGDPTTLWHTTWDVPAPKFPHELTIALEKPTRLQTLTFVPRQDGNRNGWIKEFELYLSRNWQEWGKPFASGSWNVGEQPKIVRLDPPVETQFIRLVAKSGHGNGPWASLAEVDMK
jgi:hypothetical protein